MQILQTARLVVHSFRRTKIKKVCLYSTISFVGKPNAKMAKSTSEFVARRTDNITKSAEDKREYRGLELKNGMKVLLVSDPTTDKSAAAMDVNIGFLSDPKDVKGLAHFCEHMLFLGTEKYPNENDYNKYLQEHGGGSNAATYMDHTMYYFDIVPDHFKGALDRFAQFFIAPLFTESATDREINAVNSEHDKNIPSDVWRINQIDHHLSNPEHPYHTFGTGNIYTLKTLLQEKGISVRDELLKFHNQWYSSNIMSLAVLGKESLDELEAMVVELFSVVKNKQAEAPRWEKHPYKDDQMRTVVYIAPVKDVRNLNILFPCEDFTQYYKSSVDESKFGKRKYNRGRIMEGHWVLGMIADNSEDLRLVPLQYISHLVGHEGPRSILSSLKARGWSNNLVAGQRTSTRGFSFFGISVDLTEEGMKHTDDIVKLVFQYLNMLRQEKPQEWVQAENKAIADMVFRFKDKETPRGYISNLVNNLQYYPLEDVLYAHYCLTEWRPDLIEMALDDFVADKVRIGIVAKAHEDICTEKEPWYGTKYKLEKIPDETLKQWLNAGPSQEIGLPNPNEFIPSDFTIYPREEERVSEHPTIIEDNAIMRVWHKQDDKFLLPKANLMFDFVSPLAYLDPVNCNLTHMFVQLFRDALNEYAYAADLAGLKWELINTKYGLILGISGYNNKQFLLLEKIMEVMTEFKIDPKRFNILKENYIRNLKNFSAEQPYQHAVYYLTVLLTEHSWTKEELLGSIEQITIERLEQFIPQLLEKMHIECLIHGNIDKTMTNVFVQIVERALIRKINITPLLPRQLLLNRELKLEDGCYYLYEKQNQVHKSSCVELYYQCGLQSEETNVKLELFCQLIQEPCFNILRTKEQLGYIVFSGVRKANGVQGLRIIVQSDRHPDFLDGRIEEFLLNMRGYISDMSDEEFLRHREALAAHRLEKPKQLSALTNQYWGEITAQQYHFDRAESEVVHLRALSKKDVLEFYDDLLCENAKCRKKLSVHIVSMAEGGAGVEPEQDGKPSNTDATPCNEKANVNVINDITVFKSSHEMYQLVQPYIAITRKGNKCKL